MLKRGSGSKVLTGHRRMHARMFIIAAALVMAINISHSAPLREQQFQLSIERGPLAYVLDQFSQQTGLHIGVEITVDHSRAHNLGPFVGLATADDAMKELLAGTDLWYAWRAEDTIRLFLISSQRTSWSSGVVTAKEASDSIQGLAGVRYETGMCSNLSVGPFNSEEPMTAEAFWIELIRRHCPVIRRRTSDTEPGSVDGRSVAGETEHPFSVPKMPRILALRRISEQAGIEMDYLSTDAEEERALVGPIAGEMSLNEALRRALRDSVLRIRWPADDAVSVEPAYTMATYADMSKCPCNFGLPELRPLETAHLTVIKPRLPPLEAYSQAPVRVFDRRFIDAAGASSIPELLNYLTQQSFGRSRGYRPNAAQYFEGRGFGPQYPLVLIDGHRAYGSAGDPISNAFDLNAVPLSAVERIEVAFDQPSLEYGTDAIGGTVNIVLRRALEKSAATLSLGSAEGGAGKNLVTLLADHQWQQTKVGFVFDHLVRDDLPGSERDRFRNQDYTRYPSAGGQDYRLPFGVPPTIHSMTGNLPGLNATSAAIVDGPGGLTLRPDENPRASALGYAAIEPKQERSSLYAFAQTLLGSIDLELAVLLGHQTASLQLFPESVPGLTWGADHPQNPFDVDVNLATLLTGLPPRKQEAHSTLERLTLDVKGLFGGWEYSAFIATHADRSRTWLVNEVDPSVLIDSLTTDDPAAALNVLSARPGEGRLPPGLLLPRQVVRYNTEAMQLGGILSGSLFEWETGSLEADVGVERRLEAARFNANAGRQERDITSIFSRLRLPILSAPGTSLWHQWEIEIGARRDFYNDVRDVTTWQTSLAWQPLSWIKFHAAYTTLFRPPSLYELHLPRFSLPYEVFDPQRNEVAAVTLVSGGNPSLHPTGGQSFDAGLTIRGDHAFKASLNYWDTRMRDRVFPVPMSDLLNAQDDVGHRIIRDSAGRLLILDTTQANFGAVSARGFDVSVEREINTRIGHITPRIDITHTVDFRYRDLPAASSPMSDRAGVASLAGSLPSWRAVGSLMIDTDWVSAALFVRHHSSYRDYSIVAGAVADRRIPAQTLLDLKITKVIGDHLTLSLGANNVLDDQPPFALIGGWEGFDSTQGNLVGREAFFDITGSF